jgi:hypothetical protein
VVNISITQGFEARQCALLPHGGMFPKTRLLRHLFAPDRNGGGKGVREAGRACATTDLLRREGERYHCATGSS